MKTTVNAEIIENQDYGVAKLATNVNIISKVKEIEANVKQRIDDLELDKIKATEENKAKITALRIQLNKERQGYEDDVKSIKKLVNEPVKLLESEMKTKVKVLYEDSVNLLQKKIDAITELQKKENDKYALDFYESLVKDGKPRLGGEFKDIPWTYGHGSSKKSIRDTVNNHFESVKKDLFIIDNHEHSSQLEKLWLQYNYNLGDALTKLQEQLILAEQLLKSRTESLEREKLEQEERIRKLEAEQAKIEIEKAAERAAKEKEVEVIAAEEILDYYFKIELTNSQLDKFVSFLVDNEIDFTILDK